MAKRPVTVKRAYSPINNAEMKPIAEIYKEMISAPGVLALFTAQDAGIDAAWVGNFDTAITNVGNIVPSITITKKGKDGTATIKKKSKDCVKYGKVLSYWLVKTFADQPGLIESFGVTTANAKMRKGETEGLLFDLNNIIGQTKANQVALVAKGWPISNLADYEGLRTLVNGLNTQQELDKKLIPENTDDSILARNICYSYIQTLVKLKDIVYYEDLGKRHEWAVSTNLNQIRGGGKGN